MNYGGGGSRFLCIISTRPLPGAATLLAPWLSFAIITWITAFSLVYAFNLRRLASFFRDRIKLNSSRNRQVLRRYEERRSRKIQSTLLRNSSPRCWRDQMFSETVDLVKTDVAIIMHNTSFFVFSLSSDSRCRRRNSSLLFFPPSISLSRRAFLLICRALYSVYFTRPGFSSIILEFYWRRTAAELLGFE